MSHSNQAPVTEALHAVNESKFIRIELEKNCKVFKGMLMLLFFSPLQDEARCSVLCPGCLCLCPLFVMFNSWRLLPPGFDTESISFDYVWIRVRFSTHCGTDASRKFTYIYIYMEKPKKKHVLNQVQSSETKTACVS